MPQSVLSRRRSFVARLTALAMVASLMVIGAAPASAAIDTSDSCPSTTPSAGFTDIGGLDATTQMAINCLAAYDITQGTSATTYSPNMDVTRWQMALFLTRQAEVHDITLPSGAPQGFADIAGLPASTQIAINQLSQLEITQGTSATTFSPHDPVTRWQMALFLTRLATAAGLTLPSGAPQGFDDLAGLSNEAVLAINQLAQLDIADGTSATTFTPFANVNRWQMALFLTRTLAVDGVTPSQALVSIAPSDAVTLNTGQSRTFTATFLNPNGTPYVGPITLSVRETITGTPAASDTTITAITDGLTPGTATVSGLPGADGMVTFTITNTATENVVVRAWQDLPSGTTGTLDAGEPMAVTSTITFSAVAAPAAISNAADYDAMVVSSTVKASNTFVAAVGGVNCGNGAGVACTFSYDDNDIFSIGGSAATMAQFEAALSATDVVTINPYVATAAGQSNFALTNNTAPVVVTTPSAAVTVDQATYTIVGTANPGATVRVYTDPGNDLKDDEPGEGVTATTTATEDGAFSVAVNLTQNSANNFFVEQVVGGVIDLTEVDVPTITDGTNAAALILSAVGTHVAPGAAGTLDLNDTVAITFNEAITGVGNGDTVSIFDGDGTTAVLTVGGNVSAAVTGGGTVLTLTVTAAVPGTGGTIGGIQTPATISAVSGFQGADGLAINVAGSAPANRTFAAS